MPQEISARSEIRWRHSRTEAFNKCFDALPERIKERARIMFRLLQRNPEKTDLRPLFFKRDVWRISIGTYRAAAHRDGNHFRWLWIGSHQDYDGFLSMRWKPISTAPR